MLSLVLCMKMDLARFGKCDVRERESQGGLRKTFRVFILLPHMIGYHGFSSLGACNSFLEHAVLRNRELGTDGQKEQVKGFGGGKRASHVGCHPVEG